MSAADTGSVFLEAQGRREACALLARTYAGLRDSPSPSPRLISITGRPGVGKTRVVQRFYEELAATQTYWPRSLIDNEEPLLSRQRKRIRPPHTVHVGQGSMPFLWLGVDCERRETESTDDLADLGAIVREHLPSAFVSSTSAGKTLRHLGEAMGDEVLSTGGGMLLEEAAKATVPGVGFALAAAKLARRKRREHKQHATAEAIELDERVVDVATRKAADFVDDVRAVSAAKPGLPIIVVIEDAHHASAALTGAVQALVDEGDRLPVPFIALAWDDQLRAQATIDADSFGRAVQVLDGNPALQRTHLELFSDGTLAEYLALLAPGTAPATASALATQAGGNPFVLQLMLENNIVRDATDDGAIRLSTDEVELLPTGIEDALRVLWDQLADAERKALAIASLQGRVFVPSLLDSARALVPPNDPARLVEQVASKDGWVRLVEADLAEFVERYNFDLAAAHLRTNTAPARRTEATAQICSAIAEHAWASTSRVVADTLRAIHLELASSLARAGNAALVDLRAALGSAVWLVGRGGTVAHADGLIALLAEDASAIESDYLFLLSSAITRCGGEFPALVLSRTDDVDRSNRPAAMLLRAQGWARWGASAMRPTS